jgi:hypothetical protein
VEHIGKNSSLHGSVHVQSNSQFHFRNNEWHVSTVLESHRLSYDPAQLQYRYDLLDWMLIRAARTALYTQGSTFSKTARMAVGWEGQRHDRLFNFGDDGTCACPHAFSP